MKLAILGDLHFVGPEDPLKQHHEGRAHFARAWPSYRALARRIRNEAPDLVVCLGDLVDWYSDENRDFALSLLGELGIPWVATPGNHDLHVPAEHSVPPGISRTDYARAGWERGGVELHNRAIDAGGTTLLLLDSHNSSVPDGTTHWLAQTLRGQRGGLLFTHVPLHLPQVVSYIESVEPGRNISKYTLSGAPWLFDALQGRVARAFSGHLHFPGRVNVQGITLHLLSTAVRAVGRTYLGEGKALILSVGAPPVEIAA